MHMTLPKLHYLLSKHNLPLNHVSIIVSLHWGTRPCLFYVKAQSHCQPCTHHHLPSLLYPLVCHHRLLSMPLHLFSPCYSTQRKKNIFVFLTWACSGLNWQVPLEKPIYFTHKMSDARQLGFNPKYIENRNCNKLRSNARENSRSKESNCKKLQMRRKLLKCNKSILVCIIVV